MVNGGIIKKETIYIDDIVKIRQHFNKFNIDIRVYIKYLIRRPHKGDAIFLIILLKLPQNERKLLKWGIIPLWQKLSM